MKKILLTSAIVAGALLAGIGAGNAQAKKYVFALVPKNMNNPFFDQALAGCKKAEKEANGAFECLYIGPGEHGGGEDESQDARDGGGGKERRVFGLAGIDDGLESKNLRGTKN